jgi:hypothetical protein
MSRVENDRDMVAKTIVPSTVSGTTDPTNGDTISDCTHTVSDNKLGHVMGITISGSAAGGFFLNINDSNVYPLRIAANGMVRVLFYYNTFTGEEAQTIKIVAASDLTGQYEACMEIYEEPVSS